MGPRRFKVRLDLNGSRATYLTGNIQLTPGDFVVFLLRRNSGVFENVETMGRVLSLRRTKKADHPEILIVEHIPVAKIHFRVDNQFGFAVSHVNCRKYKHAGNTNTLTVVLKDCRKVVQLNSWQMVSVWDIRRLMRTLFTEKFMEKIENEFC